MEAQTDNLIFSINDLKVSYGFRTAVSGISLKLEKGRSLGILGVNGAGKTSTIKALIGMVRPKSGTISILGKRPGSTSAFKLLGFAPEDGTPPDFLTGEEYLNFVGSLKVNSKETLRQEIAELMTVFEVPEKKVVREFSKGMKRRLVLAQSLLGSPKLLILDEPLNGLDPLMIIKLRERLELYRNQGGSILYCSHILSEVEKTCTDIGVLFEGQLKFYGSVEEAVKKHGSVESLFSALSVKT